MKVPESRLARESFNSHQLLTIIKVQNCYRCFQKDFKHLLASKHFVETNKQVFFLSYIFQCKLNPRVTLVTSMPRARTTNASVQMDIQGMDNTAKV